MDKTTVLTQHFYNASNQRQYRLEVLRDLIGDVIVARYYGTHRHITVHGQLEDALDVATNVVMTRLKRGYHVIHSPNAPTP